MIEKNIIDMTCNGECSRCGSCCGLFIPFTDEELSTIKQYVKEHNIKPYNRINVLTGQFNAHCCFYDETEKKCRIYEVRPFACRDFICNRKDWKLYRDKYEQRAKYNSTLTDEMIMASFDDLIYEDYEPILRYLFSLIPNSSSKGIESDNLVQLLKQINRLDLLKFFSAYDENGNEIKGENLINK